MRQNGVGITNGYICHGEHILNILRRNMPTTVSISAKPGKKYIAKLAPKNLTEKFGTKRKRTGESERKKSNAWLHPVG